MSQSKPPAPDDRAPGDLLGDRRRKLERLRGEFGLDPFGQRHGRLVSLAEARAAYDEEADLAHRQDAGEDPRPVAHVAGRVMQHRVMGNLIFMRLRDATGDLQVAVSKKAVGQPTFSIAKMTDYGDVVAARGPLAKTKTGEVTVWAGPMEGEGGEAGEASGGYTFLTKSLALPPGKYHGLEDPQTRYRKRYVDLYANPRVMTVFRTRSRLVKAVRDLLFDRGFIEVETPMMQSVPGGAAARPFVTHHNALDMELFLRIAPELYLKRLLVGGMPRVFEINRNFRNEGVSPRHNPEFTMLELYEAFGDLYTILELTETLIRHLAIEVAPAPQAPNPPETSEASAAGEPGVLPFGDHLIDYRSPFRRARYFDLFEEHNGFPASDHDKLLERAGRLGLETAGKSHEVVVNAVWEQTVEAALIQPTFVIDYPASLCPLTKRKPGEPGIAERFELFIGGMELANAYTELNDPDAQEANFQQQVEGLDPEEAALRNVDEDFLEALRVGMPPAGGLGVGIDRLVMLMTNQRSIRDVILFPLLKPKSQD